MLNIIIYQRNRKQNHEILIKMDKIKKTDKYWWECGEIRTLAFCWWDCTIVWKTVREFLKNLNTESPHDLATVLLEYAQEIWKHSLHKNLYQNVHSNSLVTQLVENLPAVQETWVRSLGWEDPLEKEMATHSSVLAWKIMDRGAWRATFHGVPKSRARLSD